MRDASLTFAGFDLIYMQSRTRAVRSSVPYAEILTPFISHITYAHRVQYQGLSGLVIMTSNPV